MRKPAIYVLPFLLHISTLTVIAQTIAILTYRCLSVVRRKGGSPWRERMQALGESRILDRFYVGYDSAIYEYVL